MHRKPYWLQFSFKRLISHLKHETAILESTKSKSKIDPVGSTSDRITSKYVGDS